MPEKPYEPLLHRDLHIHDVENHFSGQLELMRDIVNYGTNLIPACLASSEKSLGDAIVIGVLLKQLVSMLDGLEVLISKACVPVGVLQARAIFETSVQLDFILSEDKDKKAEFFYVSNVRKDLLWAKRSKAGEPEEQDFRNVLGEFSEVLEPTREKLQEASDERIAVTEEFLSIEPWKSINSRFDEIRGKGKFDPKWYEEFGYKSFRQLSDAVGRLHEYELFYTMGSEKMHGSDYKSHITFTKGKVALAPVRNLSSISSVLNFSLTSAMRSYQAVLREYREGQLEEFSNRYKRDWREPFLSIKNVQYTDREGGPIQL